MSRVTPPNITSLSEGEIFVFGSSLAEIAGIHGDAASKQEQESFGAIQAAGEGLQGSSYALPTKDQALKTLPLERIKGNVDWFCVFASCLPHLKFLVTEVGCGPDERTPKDIAPLFEEASKLENVWLPESFWEVLNADKH